MKFWGGLFLLAAGLNIVIGLNSWPSVFAGNLDDPDSYMRLVRLLQGIHQGHLTNIVARDDSGAGIMVEWSKLLDALLWFLALPLAPFLGWRAALFDVGVALGPIGVGALGLTLAYAAEPFAARRFLWAAAASAALAPGLAAFAVPGMIHYHILLAVLIALTAGFTIRAWQGDTGYGFLAGLAGGFAIWLTPETYPFILMLYATLLFRWLQTPIGACLTATAAGCFDVLGFGFAIDPPTGGYGVAEADRLSVVYVVLSLFLLIGGAFLWRLQLSPNRQSRRLRGAAVMAALMLAWIGLFPKVAMGPYGIMSPADAKLFFGVLLEPQPLAGIHQVIAYLLPGFLALLFASCRAAAAAGMARALWAYLAFCIFVTLVLADRFLLFTEFPAAIAACLIPLMLSDASTRFKAPVVAMLGRIAILALMFAAPLLPAFARPPAQSAGNFPSCSLRGIAALLAPAGTKIILATPEATPEILYRTQAETVGSLYQHGVPGYLRDRAAWRAPPGIQPPDAVTATGAAYLLFCPAPDRHPMISDLPPDTLWDALNNNQPPGWLRRIAAGPNGWRLYQIAPHG